MASTINLSKIMRVSWIIQKNSTHSRSRALIAAWAISLNEDLVIQHVAFKLNHHRAVPQKALNQISIFNP